MRARPRQLLLSSAALALGVALLALPGAEGSGTSAMARAAATPTPKMRCFGAPSRDIVKPCRNAALRTRVFPTPDDALLYPNAPCVPQEASVPFQCTFGVAEDRARATVALVGDSHASHWRGALNRVAAAYRWHGVSITRSSCTFSAAEPVLPRSIKPGCIDWRRHVHDWFTAHPEVRTVFISQHPGNVVVPAGSTERKTQLQGFRDAWKALPPTVRHVVVIRDTPYQDDTTPDCVTAALHRRQDAGRVCALPRRQALHRDRAAEAVRLYKLPGVRLIDMNDFMCSTRSCFPVVGGALTHKDQDHITVVFSDTLGPFLLRRVRALGINV